MALHVVVRRHERQVNPVNILLAKDLDGVVSMATVRPDKSAAALDALKRRMTKHGWFGQEAVTARKEQRAVLRTLRFASSPLAANASVSTRGVICQETRSRVSVLTIIDISQ
jgi:hypothetical protein